MESWLSEPICMMHLILPRRRNPLPIFLLWPTASGMLRTSLRSRLRVSRNDQLLRHDSLSRVAYEVHEDMMMEPLLEVRNLSKHFLGIRALEGVNFTINTKERVGL